MRRIQSDQWPLIVAVSVLLISGGALVFYILFQKPSAGGPSAPPAAGPSSSPSPVKSLSALAPDPRWDQLARFADTQTAADFRQAMERVYGDGSPSWQNLLALSEDAGRPPRVDIVRWSADAAAPRQSLSLEGTRPPPRYWREASELPPSSDPAGRPLEGVKVALDPGHIGGAWARMEQRWYQSPGETTAVMEGEMTLWTARLLQPALEALGAQVSLVREASEPVTATRPNDFTGLAPTPQQAELFFYRKAEIRARADKVNQQLQPDLLVCLHFNAEPWGEPGKVTFTEVNHLHLIVNGHYDAAEMALDDVRYEMLERVLQRSEREELRLADAVAKSLAAATGLPPYDYGAGHMAGNAHRPLPENPYVWARNLMANRLYQCPVVFTEPYVMNNREVYDRVAAGDYEGEKLVAGKMRPSLYREYAGAVAHGLKSHFLAHRPAAPGGK
jgi:N-acetylmuramoyl-L-alanine amidase